MHWLFNRLAPLPCTVCSSTSLLGLLACHGCSTVCTVVVSCLLKQSKNEEVQTSQRVCIPSITSHSHQLVFHKHSYFTAFALWCWHFSANPLLRQQEWAAEPQQSFQTALGFQSECHILHKVVLNAACIYKLWNIPWRLGHLFSKAPPLPDTHRGIPWHFHSR